MGGCWLTTANIKETKVGRHPTGKAKYSIQHLWSIHHEILRRTFLGQKAPVVARVLGITSQTVSNTINSDLGRQILARMHDKGEDSVVDVQQRIIEHAPEALDVIVDSMKDHNEDSKLRTALAKDILDRAGLGAPRKIEGKVVHALFETGDIEEMKRRLNKAKSPVEVPAEVVA